MRKLLLLALFCFGSLQAQPQFAISTLMGPGDQRAVGINRLSPGEQEALEAWINLWTIKTVEHVLSKRCKCTAEECLASLYDEVGGGTYGEPPPKNNMEKVERTGGSRSSYPQEGDSQDTNSSRLNSNDSQPSNTRAGSKVNQIEQTSYLLISDIQRNGGLVILEDGTNWEVAPPDQTISGRWHRKDKIQVVPGTQYGDYTLRNLTTNQEARVAHPGQALRLDPFLGDTYRKAITKNVRENLNNGATIILDDGSAFDIRLSDRSSITSRWSPGTVVQVTKKGGMYPYSLKAAQNGDTVEARLQ